MSKNKSMWNNGEGILFDNKGCNRGGGARLFTHYSLMATNRFKWTNLPKGVESKHIEEFLYYHGQVFFFDDEKLGYLTLPCGSAGQLNTYGEPLTYSVWGVDYNKILPADDGVRIRANDYSFPQAIQVQYYTDLLEEIERTINKNLKQQRFPYIIPVTKKNELTMRNMYKKLDDGDEAIFIDERLSESSMEGVKVLRTDAPYLLDALQLHKKEVINELLTLLGINNLSVQKKERLVTGEVDVNNENIEMNLELEYRNRELACKEINEKYGLNMKVEKVVDEDRLSDMKDEREVTTGDVTIGEVN